MDFDWKALVKKVAPTIGTALGGPLAGMAVRAASDAILGKPDASEEELSTALAAANPEILLKLREADNNFKLGLEKAKIDLRALDVEEERVHAGDRASARLREQTIRDSATKVLAAFVVLGFFATLAAHIFVDIPTANKSSLDIMLGAQGTGFIMVLAYYFGSSKGSFTKTLFGEKKEIEA